MTRARAAAHLTNLVGALVYGALVVGIELDSAWKLAAWPVAGIVVDAALEVRARRHRARLEATLERWEPHRRR